jgi:hypothetical protein
VDSDRSGGRLTGALRCLAGLTGRGSQRFLHKFSKISRGWLREGEWFWWVLVGSVGFCWAQMGYDGFWLALVASGVFWWIRLSSVGSGGL